MAAQTGSHMVSVESDAYKCGHCGFQAGDERTVRTHIASLDDADHADRGGWDVDSRVVHLDEHGQEMDAVENAVSKNPDKEEVLSLVEGLTDKQQAIIAMSYKHPQKSAEEIHSILDDKLDDSPSYTYVVRYQKEYFSEDGEEREEKSYEDLNDRQQTAVDMLAERDKDTQSIAALARVKDEKAQYLYQVNSEFGHIIGERRKELEAQQAVEDFTAEESDDCEEQEDPKNNVGEEVDDGDREDDDWVVRFNTPEHRVDQTVAEKRSFAELNAKHQFVVALLSRTDLTSGDIEEKYGINRSVVTYVATKYDHLIRSENGLDDLLEMLDTFARLDEKDAVDREVAFEEIISAFESV